jgi:hypothetical protein
MHGQPNTKVISDYVQLSWNACACGLEPKRPHLLHRCAWREKLYFTCNVQHVVPFSCKREFCRVGNKESSNLLPPSPSDFGAEKERENQTRNLDASVFTSLVIKSFCNLE